MVKRFKERGKMTTKEKFEELINSLIELVVFRGHSKHAAEYNYRNTNVILKKEEILYFLSKMIKDHGEKDGK